MREGMLGVLHAEFITTARAKGLSEIAVIFKHAFPLPISDCTFAYARLTFSPDSRWLAPLPSRASRPDARRRLRHPQPPRSGH